MKTTTTVTSNFRCSLERAFKTPILGDATKIHTGYGFMPPVTHFTKDETWGKPGGDRIVYSAKNSFYKEGESALDTVIDRVDNRYWKWVVSDFRQWSMGFTKFQGEWFVEDNKDGTIAIKYVYTLFSKNILAYPFHWFLTKVLWSGYMEHAMQNIKTLAETEAPYIYQ